MFKTIIFAVIFATSLAASDKQAAAVELAKVAGEAVKYLSDPADCPIKLVPVLGRKDAKNYCEKTFGQKVVVVKRVANESADATKASRDEVVVAPQLYGGSMYYDSGAQLRQQQSAPRPRLSGGQSCCGAELRR